MKKTGNLKSWMKKKTLPKTIDTLVNDIYGLFDPKHTHAPDEEHLERVGEEFKNLLRRRLAEREPMDNPLRFSNLGKKDRQLWYEAHPDGKEEELNAKTLFLFLYGDVIELLVLFLALESGHDVRGYQEEVEIDGVKGHIDAIIDGVLVDVKSASPYSFQKFKKQDLGDDPFGYVQQLSGYAQVLTPGESAAWVAFDKVSGDMCLSPLSATIINDYPPADRITHLKEVIAEEAPPERCYEDEEDGKSGNRKLGTGCSYCKHKWRCWPGLRGFAYAGKPRYLTVVAKTPDVPEFGRRGDAEENADV